MAKFFKYRSPEDLEAAAAGLGLHLRLSNDLSALFRPVAVGGLQAGNSLCVQPMEGCDGTPDGRPGELTFRRYRRFGAGGAKLIWGEAAAVEEEGRANPRQLLLTEDTADDLARLLDECRRSHREAFGDDGDLVVGLQLTHSGRYGYRRPIVACRDPLLAGRAGVTADTPLIDDDSLLRLADRYVRAARLVARAGFQFVDVKQCHRYLLSELLAAKTRPGRFGGSLENRTRLARSVFQGIRAEAPRLLLATRLNVYDGVPFLIGAGGSGEPAPWQIPVRTVWGAREGDPLQPDLTEPLQWVEEMTRLGVALVNVTLGNPYAAPHLLRPFEVPPPDGYAAPEHPLAGVERHFRLAGEIQNAFPQLPVVGSGYSYLQDYLFQAGAANLLDNRVTFVGVGRAALANPDFARQLQEEGRVDRRKVCRTFSYCTALMRSKHNELGQFPAGCPPFDRETYGPIWEAAKRKNAGET